MDLYVILIYLPHSGCSNVRLGPLVLTRHAYFPPSYLLFVSHILDPVTPTRHTAICLLYSECCEARLGPLILHVILICLLFAKSGHMGFPAFISGIQYASLHFGGTKSRKSSKSAKKTTWKCLTVAGKPDERALYEVAISFSVG